MTAPIRAVATAAFVVLAAHDADRAQPVVTPKYKMIAQLAKLRQPSNVA